MQHRPVRFLRLVLALVFLSGSSGASAPAPEPLQLDWRAPQDCPDKRWAHQRVAELLTEAPEHASHTPRRAIVVLSELAAGRWHLELRLTGPDSEGRRELEGGTCHEVAEAATLMIALVVSARSPAPEPDTHARPAPVPPAVARTAAGSAQGAAEVAGEKRLRPAAPGNLIWSLLSMGGFEYGNLPAVNPSIGLALGAHFPAFKLEAHGGAALPRRVVLSGVPTAGAEIDGLWMAGLRACLTRSVERRLELAGCLGAQLDLLSVTGFGVEAPRHRRAVLPRASLGGALAWAVSGRVRVVGGVDLGVGSPGPKVTIVEEGTLFQPHSMSLRVWLGPQLRFDAGF